MQKALIFGCIIGSLAIILGKFGFYEAALMLFVAGIIPGTHYAISATGMFYLLIITMAAVFAWLGRGIVLDIINGMFHAPSTKKTGKKLPKRRFSRI